MSNKDLPVRLNNGWPSPGYRSSPNHGIRKSWTDMSKLLTAVATPSTIKSGKVSVNIAQAL